MRLLVGVAIAGTLTAGLLGQSQSSGSNVVGSKDHPRSFVVIEDSSLRTSQGSWDGTAPMWRYVKEHPGSYVVFTQDGALYRLDKPEQLAEVHTLYQPMQALTTKQEALAHAQQALAGEEQRLAHSQQTLAKRQQSLGREEMAASNPGDQARIGQGQGTLGQAQGDLGGAQGDLGRQQGDLGAMQGVLGKQQGEIARAAYHRMQAIFDGCLADGSCRRVS